jgi:hypothetical protein
LPTIILSCGRGLVTLLVPRNGMEVVGEATNGLEAVALAQTLQPDVILMDLIMPELEGTEAIQHIKRQNPGRAHPRADQLWRKGESRGGDPGWCAGLSAQGFLARRPLRRYPQRVSRQPVHPTGVGPAN